ncbi:MAG: PQQ-dependent sugar dehydrogenase, partial [Chloroflexi bacterium]|nr:PQQ-dependent sugar dehydrogenase [Chloroflexota bacterium]
MVHGGMMLAGVNYTTGNPLTPDVSDTATTGAYRPFGTPSQSRQVVRGRIPCTGAILRANLDGSGLEVFADGFRNPYGLAFHPDGRLFTVENGPDARGRRPVSGPDNFYEVVQGGWYGFPDFYGGVPVNDPSRRAETGDLSQPVLQNPPPLARQPIARLANHSTSVGFDFSRAEAFAPVGEAFIAQLGDLTPTTAGGVKVPAGRQVQLQSGRPLLSSWYHSFCWCNWHRSCSPLPASMTLRTPRLEENTMATQRTEGQGAEPEHTHLARVHSHDHYHVSHHHRDGLLTEWEHRTYWH